MVQYLKRDIYIGNNIQNDFRPNQVNTSLDINLVDILIPYYSLVFLVFRRFFR